MNRRYLVLTLVYCGAIFWLSSREMPAEPPSFWFPGLDKVVHMTLYGGLATVVSLGLRRRKSPARGWVQWVIPVVVASLYGVTDEYHQSFVPTRSPDVMDWLADTVGALAAQAVLCGWLWRVRLFGRRA